MKISRRAMLGIGLGAAAAATAGAVAFAGPVSPARGGAKYHPGPGDRRLKGPGDMVMQQFDGAWKSHMLPFAAPTRSKTAVLTALRAARAQRLIA